MIPLVLVLLVSFEKHSKKETLCLVVECFLLNKKGVVIGLGISKTARAIKRGLDSAFKLHMGERLTRFHNKGREFYWSSLLS